MPLLVRWIKREIWPEKNEVINGTSLEDLPAEPITLDLKANENTISTWEVDSVEDLEKAVVAIVCGFNKPSAIDLVYFEKSEVTDSHLTIDDESPGLTVTAFSKMHRDISDVCYGNLGNITWLIINSINQDRVNSYTNTEVSKIINKYINNGTINANEELSKDFMKRLNSLVSAG